ncbi:hypothetical protein [Alterisphingorhabdus coralli]|uniref:Uncharacterized protein n=1 Tax=Alterisphingorhabdus coralli TaxID=3071408 RepID=A0AA97F514_9SPHN|nr:hypothetical protein [Parasphingorhabdus sp. SCSIO 66989]WOE74424.1 hypothetical protein RB602_11275 [Parasphingorhabdus sp. SCSIO 66989]
MLNRLFRLPPIAYFIAAPVILAIAAWLGYSSYADNAERAAARSHEAPAAVGLDAVASGETDNDYDEVVVRAQGDASKIIETTETIRRRRGGSRTITKLYMPLYPADAKDFSAPAPAVMEVRGKILDQQLESLMVAEGPAGPVLELNGQLEGGGNSGAEEALPNTQFAENFVTINVFKDGREVALQKDGNPGFILMLSLILAIASVVYGFIRKRFLDGQANREAAQPAYQE